MNCGRLLRPATLLTALAVSNYLGGSALADPVPRLPNLRAQRDPGSWTARGHAIGIDVTATRPVADEGVASWALKVTVHVPAGAKNPRLSTYGAGVELVAQPSIEAGLMNGVLAVRADTACTVDREDEPVSVRIAYELDGRAVEEDVAVDSRCFLGHVVAAPEPSEYARLARESMNDPAIERAFRETAEGAERSERAQRVAGPEGRRARSAEAVAAGGATGARAAVDALRQWLSHERVKYVADPYDSGVGWEPGRAYTLEPSETLRLGGDCEDWAILAAAFLARCGVPVAIVEAPGHVWARAYEGGSAIDVDLTNAPSLGSPDRTSWVAPDRARSGLVARAH